MRLSGRQLVLWLLLLSAAPLAAQSLTGSITGTVRDQQGGVLPGVTVSLTGKTGDDASRRAMPTARIAFTAVEPGSYIVAPNCAASRGRRREHVTVDGRQSALDVPIYDEGRRRQPKT